MGTVKLQSSDGELFETDVAVAKCSVTIKTMLEDCGLDDGEEEGAVIPIPNVNSYILKLVLQWAEYHKNDEILDDDDESKKNGCDNILPWDANFLKVDQGTLFDLILAANYLDVKGLLAAACKTVANLIKGKSPKEIRETFNIIDDFSPAEREQMDKENGWCDGKD